jgi:hypothetical protein|tara:strand:+ start:117 stop:575 length:459 start_codon:yes stop_codon:yes gene_type:complete
MDRYFFIILISLLFSNQLLAKNINIQENINLSFKCELEKKIIKNSEYNYQVFLSKDLDKKDLKKFEIKSLQPETLLIKGLSSFLSSIKLDVKIVNKDVVLFKAIDNDTSYSESGIIDRKTGELVHEVTKNIKSENAEKDITFYSCSKLREKV